MKINKNVLWISVFTAIAFGLSGCATTPKAGGASGMTAGGSAAGGTSQGEKSPIEHCDASLGTVAIDEDKNADWWHYYRSNYPKLDSTIPVLRLIIQQSNCLVVVERGTSMNNMMRERELMNSGELRGGSNFGKGQMVAADFTMQPSLQFSAKGTGGLGGAVGGLFGDVIGGMAASMKSNEAAATLLLIENRSGVQVSAAMGNAKNWDIGGFGGGWFGMFAGLGGFSNTPEGKVIITALVDSYNNMVKALRNYKAQEVKGGLGKGGQLRIGQ
ncbi:MAG: CsgG/HfaB family protein [Mariprofundaceae bacterium]